MGGGGRGALSLPSGVRSTLKVEWLRFCNSLNGVWCEKIFFFFFWLTPKRNLVVNKSDLSGKSSKNRLEHTVILKTRFQAPWHSLPTKSHFKNMHTCYKLILSPNFSQIFPSTGPSSFPRITNNIEHLCLLPLPLCTRHWAYHISSKHNNLLCVKVKGT